MGPVQTWGEQHIKQHCLLWKELPKAQHCRYVFNLVCACSTYWQMLAFWWRLLWKGFFQKIPLLCLSYSINAEQHTFFPGTRTCVLWSAFTQVFGFQHQFSSQSKIPQINSRIWGRIFLLIGLWYWDQPQAELREATVKGGGVSSDLLLKGSQTLPPGYAKPLSKYNSSVQAGILFISINVHKEHGSW